MGSDLSAEVAVDIFPWNVGSVLLLGWRRVIAFASFGG